MTVEELIEELKKFPKDTPVHIGWRKGSPTVANLQKVADYFGISIIKFL